MNKPRNILDAHFELEGDTITGVVARAKHEGDGRRVIPVRTLLNTRTTNQPNKPFANGKAAWWTVHETGNRNKGAGAWAHARWMARAAKYSWHATVDDGLIVLQLPFDMQGWHAGDGYHGPGNQTSLGIEHCVNEDGDLQQTYANGVEFARAARNHNLVGDGVCQHNHWSGKNCPQQLREGKAPGWTWASLRGAIVAAMPVAAPAPAQNGAETPSEGAVSEKALGLADTLIDNAQALRKALGA